MKQVLPNSATHTKPHKPLNSIMLWYGNILDENVPDSMYREHPGSIVQVETVLHEASDMVEKDRSNCGECITHFQLKGYCCILDQREDWCRHTTEKKAISADAM